MTRKGGEVRAYLDPTTRGARAAHALRFELGLDIAPIADLWSVIADRGIDLAFHRFGQAGGDGLYLWDGRRALIVINATHRKVPLRQRFTAAHELAHHEMHRVEGTQLLVADKKVDPEDGGDQSPDSEREANAFAANLLAPDRALKREFEGRDSETVEPLDVVRMTKKYGLSYYAMVNRLLHANCIRAKDRSRLHAVRKSPQVIPQLMKAIQFDPIKAFPPPPALPESYVGRVADLVQRHVIDHERAAELLRADTVKEAVEMVAPFAATRDDGTHADDDELDRLLGG